MSEINFKITNPITALTGLAIFGVTFGVLLLSGVSWPVALPWGLLVSSILRLEFD
jgi:hypothetical protein